MSQKPHLNLVICGHVDHGKSTLTGHMLYLTGAVDERTIKEYEEQAKALGKETFKYAWVLDTLKEERERGLTIDLEFVKFETDKFFFTIIDAPGHRDFIKNMITGASQADAALLVVSAKTGEYETGIQPGGQAREHAFLLMTLGVRQLVVAINKMDDVTVNWSQKRFEDCKNGVIRLLKTIGYNVEKTPIVPVSGWTGDNIVKPSEKMPWYKGPTLLQALDVFEVPPKPVDKPLRIPIQDVYTITGVGTVPVGRVETGILKEGQTVVFMPSGAKGEIRSIETHHVRIKEAYPGDNIGFNVRGVSKTDIRRGDVAGPVDNPPTVAKEIIARIIVVYHPTAIAVGYTPVMHIHTAHVPCKFVELIRKINPRTGETIEENPSFLRTGECAIVKLQPLKPVVAEEYTVIPQLGRFAIRDMGTTIAAGIVEKIVAKGP